MASKQMMKSEELAAPEQVDIEQADALEMMKQAEVESCNEFVKLQEEDENEIEMLRRQLHEAKLETAELKAAKLEDEKIMDKQKAEIDELLRRQDEDKQVLEATTDKLNKLQLEKDENEMEEREKQERKMMREKKQLHFVESNWFWRGFERFAGHVGFEDMTNIFDDEFVSLEQIATMLENDWEHYFPDHARVKPEVIRAHIRHGIQDIQKLQKHDFFIETKQKRTILSGKEPEESPAPKGTTRQMSVWKLSPEIKKRKDEEKDSKKKKPP